MKPDSHSSLGGPLRNVDPSQAERRVEELGLTVDLLASALDLAAADARSCTDFDAKGTPGQLFWSRSNRYLGENLQPHGWDYTRQDHILRAIHPSRTHAITALSGSGGVGDRDVRVRSKNPKGSAVTRVVEKNGQAALLSEDEVIWGRDLDDVPTWCLLYKRDEQGVQAELSLPVKVNGKFIDEWKERNPLSLPDVGDPGTDLSLDNPLDPDDDDTDVVVEYRES